MSSDQKLKLSYEIFLNHGKVRVGFIVSDSRTSRYHFGIAISIWPRSIILIFAWICGCTFLCEGSKVEAVKAIGIILSLK